MTIENTSKPTTVIIQAWDTQDITHNRKAIENIIVNALKERRNEMFKAKRGKLWRVGVENVLRFYGKVLYFYECKLKQVKKWYLGIVILKTLDALFNLENVAIKRGDDLAMRRSNWHKMKRFVDEQCGKLDKEFNELTGLNLPGAK